MSDNAQMTITGFLEARIAEDERHARMLAETDRRPVLSLSATVNHPQRLLAECAAKRAVVELHPTYIYTDEEPGFEMEAAKCLCGGSPCATLQALAAVYRDHPDYREEWA